MVACAVAGRGADTDGAAGGGATTGMVGGTALSPAVGQALTAARISSNTETSRSADWVMIPPSVARSGMVGTVGVLVAAGVGAVPAAAGAGCAAWELME